MNDQNPNYCVVVPCYENHANKLESTLLGISKNLNKIIVVDDGSSIDNARKIQKITNKIGAILVVNRTNGGKGAAIKLGLQKAYQLNFTHAIQIDSDGQHDLSSIKELIEISKKNPQYLISGRPVYDKSIPMGRKFGRYITHFWVWIETLSLDILDSMCGFRAYPLHETIEVLKSPNIGNRMDFDPEIMVRFYWFYKKIKFLPINVKYPEDGLSYFNVLNDNWLITKMHTKLFFGMLIRMPKLIFNRSYTRNWRNQNEKGVIFLIKMGLLIHRQLGERISSIIISFISFYYSIFAVSAVKSSNKYKRIYCDYCRDNNFEIKNFNSFQHIKSFSNMFLDRLSVWRGDISFNSIEIEDIENFRRIQSLGKGGLFISSHYGNLEILRALGRLNNKIKFKALIYTKNSKKLYSILKEFSPDVEDSIIPIQNFTPEIATKLVEYSENGEWIFCMGDRITEKSTKSITTNLLGKKINLPMGPFFISFLLNVPTYSFHCYKNSNNKFQIDIEEISKDIKKSRFEKETYFKQVSAKFVKTIEKLIIKDPKQWFNFYDFWESK